MLCVPTLRVLTASDAPPAPSSCRLPIEAAPSRKVTTPVGTPVPVTCTDIVTVEPNSGAVSLTVNCVAAGGGSPAAGTAETNIRPAPTDSATDIAIERAPARVTAKHYCEHAGPCSTTHSTDLGTTYGRKSVVAPVVPPARPQISTLPQGRGR